MMRAKKLFDDNRQIFEAYLPTYGQGITMATQTVTALFHVMCEWMNQGNLFDRRRLKTEVNADAANWLYIYGDDATQYIMDKVSKCNTGDEYDDLLERLVEHVMDVDDLEALDRVKSRGDITECPGRFVWTEMA